MDKIVEYKNIWKLDRWSRYEFNHASDYERYMEADRGKKRKYRESVINIIAHDRDYKNCNIHQIVERWDIGKEKKVTGSTAKNIENRIIKRVEDMIKQAIKKIA